MSAASVAPADAEDADQKENVIVTMDRGCTDWPILLLFIAFCFGMWIVATEAFSRGDLNRIQYGINWRGDTCNEGVQPMYQYWPNPLFFNKMHTVCIAECPSVPEPFFGMNFTCVCNTRLLPYGADALDNTTLLGAACQTVDGLARGTVMIDADTATAQLVWPDGGWSKYAYWPVYGTFTISGIMKTPNCAPLYNTEQALGRCVPSVPIETLVEKLAGGCTTCSDLYDDLASDGLKQIWADLFGSVDVLAASPFVAMVVAVVVVVLLRQCALVAIYIVIGALLCSFCLVTYLCYGNWQLLQAQADQVPPLSTQERDAENAQYWQIFFYIFAVLSGAWLCFAIVMCKRIVVAARLIELSGELLMDMPLIFLISPLSFLFVFLVTVPWLAIGVVLATAGDLVENPDYGFAEYEYSDELKGAGAYWIFGFFWLTELIGAVSFCVMAWCVAVWFFAPLDEDGDRPLPMCYMTLSVKTILRHHLGTACTGSLLVAIVRMIRIIFEYIEKKKEEYGIPDNKLVEFVFCVIRSCLYCLEKCVRWCTETVYVQTVCTGCWFCPGIYSAMAVLIDNMSYMAVCYFITAVIMFFAKLACAMGATALCNYWLQQRVPEEISSALVPTILILVVSMLVAHAFFEVPEQHITRCASSICAGLMCAGL